MRLDQYQFVALLAEHIESLHSSEKTVTVVFGGEGNCHKTTIARRLCDRLALRGITAAFLEIDSFARDRQTRLSERISGYNPQSFDITSFHEALLQAAGGSASRIPYYDHQSGRVCANSKCREHVHEVPASEVLIAIGVFFTLEPTGLQPDMRIFFRSRGFGKIFSRLRRDILTRGYNPYDALANYVRMRADYQRWMQPAIIKCNWLINVSGSSYRRRLLQETEELM